LRSVLGTKFVKAYHSATVIVIESAVLYPIAVSIYLGLGRHRLAHEMGYRLLAQVVGIAPTLILVRVGLSDDGEPALSRFSLVFDSAGSHT